MPSSTSSGASSMRGRPGVSASAMPAMTRRMDGAVLSRRATTATTTSTARRNRIVWIVAVMDLTEPGLRALSAVLPGLRKVKSSRRRCLHCATLAGHPSPAELSFLQGVTVMRLPLIAPADLTPEQKPLYDDMRQGIASNFTAFKALRDDGALMGPWNPWLHEPAIGKAIWDLTLAMTANASLPDN